MVTDSFRIPADTFTAEQRRALNIAYEVLTRVGNATADPAHGTDTGQWHPVIDEAHHRLGLLLLAARVDELAGCGARYDWQSDGHPAGPQPPCTKPYGHQDAPASDTKRAEHCNGSFSWPQEATLPRTPVPPTVQIPREVTWVTGCTCNGGGELHEVGCDLGELDEAERAARIDAAARRIDAFRLGVQHSWQAQTAGEGPRVTGARR